MKINDDIRLCPECGVPEILTAEQAWLNNGELVQARRQESRLAFFECENFDPLLRSSGR